MKYHAKRKKIREARSAITESKRTENALRESEERYRQLVERSPYLIIIQANEKIVYINPAGVNMLGATSATQLIGKPIFDLAPPNFKDSARARLKEVTDGAQSSLKEQQIVRLDGQLIDVESTGTSIIYQGEAATQIIMRDISKHKLAEKERNRFFTIALDLLAIASLDGYFKQLNPAFEKILGYSNAELLSTPYLDFIHPDDQAASLIELGKLAQGQTIINFETRFRCKDGSYKWLLWTVTPDSEQGLLYATARDVTPQKQLEKELQDKNLELVAQNIKVQEANRLKNEFLTNTSHEIRTPLNGIIGMADLLLDTPMPPEQHSYAQVIRHSGEILLSVINDILDFSKIEAGKLQIEMIDFDLIRTIEEVISLLTDRARAKGLELIYSIDTAIPLRLHGDAGHIAQILNNLISNAIKFTQTGEVSLQVKLAEENLSHCTLDFQVKDSGIGISLADQTRLFQPFTQIDASNTRKYGGTGLGLVIANQLSSLMGGTITVESQPGKGSTFSFTIKLEKQPQGNVSSKGKSARKKAGERVSGRILVAEDNPINQLVARGMLESAGYHADMVANGHEVIEAIERTPYLAIIMDCQMPEMDGYATTKEIRKLEGSTRHTPIIAMTTDAWEGEREKCLEAGMDDYIAKPVQKEELYTALEYWLTSYMYM